MMLQRGKDSPLTMHGFLVGVELVESITTPEQVALRLADSLGFMEGIGHVDVESLGIIEVIPDEDTIG